CCSDMGSDPLKKAFKNPPDTAKPGVYWYFMDGNLSREGMTKDLESMKAAGISNLIFLEVGIGVPRGPVNFMSDEWQELFVHAVREAERLGIKILLGAGPGWCGSGGPWVQPEESMKHLVFSETDVRGNRKVDMTLPVPEQRKTPWHTLKNDYYEDVYAYAVPKKIKPVIEDINEKALYERYPYSSWANVKTHLSSRANYVQPEGSLNLNPDLIVNLTGKLQPGGRLVWDAPEGEWTIVRMGLRVTGASTRPSPEPVIGLESDKLNAQAFACHLKNFTDILLKKTEPRKKGAGWTGFHIDSWESGSQNWTEGIVEEFKKRRGYDPEPYFITFTGRAYQSVEITERFLWDLRLTCQELLLENHAEFAKTYAHKNGLELTIEPYDMNPAGDLDLGSVADVIMAEFWSQRFGFDTHYAVIEATSISHISGRPVVAAEAFTSNNREAWQEYPGSMKDQTDWALAMGVNRFVFHTFAHKPLGDEYKPGMTMGPYGVHWDRDQTWWPMVSAYHQYISRYSHMMQQGQGVSDILYLTPEGAPMVFNPPADALFPNGPIPDKKGYGFDGCSPKMLMERADVENGKIVFPGSTSYKIMVLPNSETMTPELLEKIASLVEKGATIIGSPPIKSPGLTGYPGCDERVKTIAEKLWGTLGTQGTITRKVYGIGQILWGGELSNLSPDSLYPAYSKTAEILSEMNIPQDFDSDNNSIRYGHRRTAESDIYFIANRTDTFQRVNCRFRAIGEPELWNGTTGETRKITQYSVQDGITAIPMEFFPNESFLITFSAAKAGQGSTESGNLNFPVSRLLKPLEGPWTVRFDTVRGGPGTTEFKELTEWNKHEQRGIKYYSGIAEYSKSFQFGKKERNKRYYLDLGEIHDIAGVTLNGKEQGIVWCAPWRIEISGALKKGENELKIEVANRWINRLLGDRLPPDVGVRKVRFENGMLGGKEFTTGRYTFTPDAAMRSFKFTEPLPSGLLGPVTVQEIKNDHQ
ncbi:MAG TPA: glycosyl hydrolase, partial [Prolixibacteraceae bacterium]|nr:glycosyl hydrolase [Prolixibacteraceae bacterium]